MDIWSAALGLFLANLAVVVPLFIWNRSESRSDARMMQANMDCMRTSTQGLILAIKDEIKDFHGRLCAIEERNKGK